MKYKNIESVMKEAKPYLKRGLFQYAVSIFEKNGMKEKAKEATLACATDCLETGRYAMAIKFFKEGGDKDLADLIEGTCSGLGFKPEEELEMYPCMPACPAYVMQAREISKKSEAMSIARDDAKKKGYIAKAMGEKIK